MYEIFCTDLVTLITSYLSIKDFIEFTLTCKKYKNSPYLSLKSNFINILNKFYNLENKTDDFSKNFIDIISNYDELSLQGTFLLDLVNNEPFDNNTEIDIFCKHNIIDEDSSIYYQYDFFCGKLQTYEPYISLNNLLINNNFSRYNPNNNKKYNKKHTPSEFEYIKDWYFFTFNKTIDKDKSKKINIYIVPQNQIINNVSFCNNFYDGKKLFLSNPHDIINKLGKLDFDQKTLKCMGELFLETKISTFIDILKKYHLKKYKILIDTKIIKILCKKEMEYLSDSYFENYMSKNILEYVRTTSNFISNDDSIKFYTVTGRCFDSHQKIYDFKKNPLNDQYVFYNNHHVCNYNDLDDY